MSTAPGSDAGDGVEQLDNQTLTAVSGLQVGHWTNLDARTGCTVVLAPEDGCLASGLVLGPAPGSRESALLEPEKSVARVDAVVLSGGSAYGLATATGVMEWLEEQGRGFDTGLYRVPIVPAAVLYDLGVGDGSVRPGAAAGRAAALAASSTPVQQGRIGAGAGATICKLLGPARSVASGIGSYAVKLNGAVVAALAVSNAVGNLVDPDTGEIVAGAPELRGLAAATAHRALPGANTTLVLVATDADIDKSAARALSLSAHIGIARVTRPSHTLFDGDSAFVLSTRAGPKVAPQALSIAVQEVVAEALLRGARAGARFGQ
ncbi:MAG: P1 family peptidase [Trueperaceae bacterium]|nr:P1 family peptidase [Trueperaceae bacterium]